MTTDKEYLNRCRTMKRLNLDRYHEDFQKAMGFFREESYSLAEEHTDRAEGWLKWYKFWRDQEQNGRHTGVSEEHEHHESSPS